jgi:hypothetical protein
VTVFGLPAGCPCCAGPLRLVNTTSNESLAVGIMRCDPCRREFEVTCRIVPHARDHWRMTDTEAA